MFPEHHVLIEIAREHENRIFQLQLIPDVAVYTVLALVDLAADFTFGDFEGGW